MLMTILLDDTIGKRERMQYIFIVMAFILFAGCAKQPEVKPLSELDACTREAGLMPRPKYGFRSVTFEKLDADKAEALCRKRVKAHPDDTYAKFLLARALTKAGKRDEAYLLLRMSCEKGDDAGCTLLGSYYYNGFTPAVFDPGCASALYERACNHGYGNACLNLGKQYLLGKGVPQDPEKSEEMIYRECKNGYAEACHQYVNSVHFKKLPTTDAKYLFAAKITCESGLDCSYYEDELDKRKDGDAVIEKAAIFETACNNGSARACEDLGTYYFEGKGVPKSEEKALMLFKQACGMGQIRFACWYQGVMMFNTGGDREESLSLISKACHEGENMFACFGLASIYLDHPSLSSDDHAAHDLLQHVCKKGNVRSCELLEQLAAK